MGDTQHPVAALLRYIVGHRGLVFLLGGTLVVCACTAAIAMTLHIVNVIELKCETIGAITGVAASTGVASAFRRVLLRS